MRDDPPMIARKEALKLLSFHLVNFCNAIQGLPIDITLKIKTLLIQI